MKRLSVVICCAVIALSGCQTATDAVTRSAEDIARGQAKTVINGVVADRLPGVDVAFATDCIVDNASLAEIFTIAKASVTGPDEGTVQTILDIGKRPETTRCLLQSSLALL